MKLKMFQHIVVSFCLVSVFELTACGPNSKTSEATPAAAEQPGEVASEKNASNPQATENLYSKIKILIEGLALPDTNILPTPQFQPDEVVKFFVTKQCQALVAKLSQAPKSVVNLYEQGLLQDFCSDSAKNLTVVPGKFLSKKSSEFHTVSGMHSSEWKFLLRMDNTIRGYEISETNEKGIVFLHSVNVDESNRKTETSTNAAGTQFQVQDLSGRWSYRKDREKGNRFGGSQTSKYLLFKDFTEESDLKIEEVVVDKVDGIFGAGQPVQVRCVVTIISKNSELAKATSFDRTCF